MTFDPSEIYQRALQLQRGSFNATAAANNPELVYPDFSGGYPMRDLWDREVAAENAYYRFLDTHRAQLEQHSDFEIDYGVLDVLAAEGRDLADLHADSGNPEAQHRDRDFRRDR
ncbi:hypothetical protein [Nocardia sp. NBC_01009]|uniref:hypothetical protein n=1 Tax=Nocardia sp. NBC_01009 TaxID=2975996 RepID=UPI00386329DA|nr:hypothetical protein OHA42_14520 [Nocardia sp. NBC_01009]